MFGLGAAAVLPRQRENSPAACALLLAVLELGRIVNNLKKCKKVAVE